MGRHLLVARATRRFSPPCWSLAGGSRSILIGGPPDDRRPRVQRPGHEASLADRSRRPSAHRICHEGLGPGLGLVRDPDDHPLSIGRNAHQVNDGLSHDALRRRAIALHSEDVVAAPFPAQKDDLVVAAEERAVGLVGRDQTPERSAAVERCEPHGGFPRLVHRGEHDPLAVGRDVVAAIENSRSSRSD